MKNEECKVGMLVKMNKLSNNEYRMVTQTDGCVAKIIKAGYSYKEVEIEIVEHIHQSLIGVTFFVDPKYFDCVTDIGTQYNFKIFKDDEGIIRVYYNDKIKAVADCNITGKWDEEFGIALALTRALKEMKTTHTETVEDYV